MKTLLLVTALICVSPSALALTTAEAKTKLGFDSTAPGAPQTELSVQMVNDAYAAAIRGLLADVARGNPGAVAASQAAAEARIVLLQSIRDCENQLSSNRSEDPKDKNRPPVPRMSAPWLNALFPNVFPAAFNPADVTEIRQLMPILVQNPQETLSSLALLEDELEPVFQNFDKNALYYFQDNLAFELRVYLRAAGNSEVVNRFGNATLAKIYELAGDTDHFSRFLHTIGTINVPTTSVQTALVTLLIDPRVEIQVGALSYLRRNAQTLGVSPELQAALLKSPNERANLVLAESKTPLEVSTSQELLRRLPQIENDQTLKDMALVLLNKSDLKTPTLFALKTVRDRETSLAPARLFAAQTLIEQRVDVERSENQMLALLANPTPEIRFNMTSWCLNHSDFCSTQVREAVEASRVPQVHHARN